MAGPTRWSYGAMQAHNDKSAGLLPAALGGRGRCAGRPRRRGRDHTIGREFGRGGGDIAPVRPTGLPPGRYAYAIAAARADASGSVLDINPSIATAAAWLWSSGTWVTTARAIGCIGRASGCPGCGRLRPRCRPDAGRHESGTAGDGGWWLGCRAQARSGERSVGRRRQPDNANSVGFRKSTVMAGLGRRCVNF